MSIEWDSLILGGNELKTVGPATENARRANSVPTDARHEQQRSAGRAHRSGRRCDGQHVTEIWRRGRRQHLVGQHPQFSKQFSKCLSISASEDGLSR